MNKTAYQATFPIKPTLRSSTTLISFYPLATWGVGDRETSSIGCMLNRLNATIGGMVYFIKRVTSCIERLNRELSTLTLEPW